MGRRETAVVGGLLSGFGEGMMLKSSNKQKDEIAKRDALIASLKGGAKGQMTDSQLVSAVTKANTTTGLYGDTVNYDNIIRTLAEREGRPDLARLITQGETQSIDEGSPEAMKIIGEVEAESAERGPWGPDFLRSEEKMSKLYDGFTSADDWEKYEIDRRLKQMGAAGSAAGSSDSQATPAASTSYATKEDVKAAYMAGEISRADASKILADKFGGT